LLKIANQLLVANVVVSDDDDFVVASLVVYTLIKKRKRTINFYCRTARKCVKCPP